MVWNVSLLALTVWVVESLLLSPPSLWRCQPNSMYSALATDPDLLVSLLTRHSRLYTPDSVCGVTVLCVLLPAAFPLCSRALQLGIAPTLVFLHLPKCILTMNDNIGTTST